MVSYDAFWSETDDVAQNVPEKTHGTSNIRHYDLCGATLSMIWLTYLVRSIIAFGDVSDKNARLLALL